ncbi:hypothetical protein HK103_003704, partial [Boothiomyces macroporosus]
MKLKERKRQVKRPRVIVVVSRESYANGLEYSKLIVLMMILMNDVSIDMFERTEIDIQDEGVEIDNGGAAIADRENDIANDSDDVAGFLNNNRLIPLMRHTLMKSL